MDSRTHDAHHRERTPSPVSLSPSPAIIALAKSQSRPLLTDLAGWPSYSDMRVQAPGRKNGSGLHPSESLASDTPGLASSLSAFQKSGHLPTPLSPGNMASYLLTRTPTSSQDSLQPDQGLDVLPTEFRSHVSPPPFQSRSIPTPDPSPLVARSRSNGPHLLSQLSRTNDGLRSRASTPPRTPSRQLSTRPMTPDLQSRPSTPSPRRSAKRSPSPAESSRPCSATPRKVKDEPGADAVPAPKQGTEPGVPDYFKRMRRLAPSSSTGIGGSSLASDLASGDGSMLWPAANMGVIDSPIRGKRIALFQETSDESFEESLMAGGYGRYRSDGPSWKRDGDEAPSSVGDTIGEGGLDSGIVLTEEENRKKARLAAFLDPPRISSSVGQLLPVEIEGRGRVLMKVEPSEPQTPPKPTSKARRSRKRKKTSMDVKADMETDGIAAPEFRAVDGPNWPDTEFPWRSRSMTSDGLSSAEREGRLRYLEGFLDRESDEDDIEEERSFSSRHDADDVPSRSSRLGGGKTFALVTHGEGRRRGPVLSSVVPGDPADARTALLSKKSIQAVQLRLLRRRNAAHNADGMEDEAVCICQGQDDGRPLVQCDACRTWYHLQCIGIQSASELGREEDPWFCANCGEVKTPPPVTAPLSEPTFVPTEDGEDEVGHEPPFLNAGLNPSPSTPWTRVRAPRTPPRRQHAPHGGSGPSSWDEAPSSSSRGDPRTPQLSTTSGFGDMVRVYGTTAGRTVEGSHSGTGEDSPFDPTSTPSRGIMFGVPFTTPKEGRWGMGSLQGVRGSGQELFHTPKQAGEEDSTAFGRTGYYHGRVGEVCEGLTGPQGLFRACGGSSGTPPERDTFGGPRRMQAMESPLGAKRTRRTFES